jgi:hypothetical protein
VKRFLILAFALLALTLVPFASADLVIDLNTTINGSSPSGSTPWATATFHTVSPGTVTLTLDNLLGSTQFIPTWLFNFSGDASALTFSYVSGNHATITADATQDLSGGNQIKAGLFNILFSWPTNNSSADRFSAGETTVYTITGGSITANSFDFLSANKPNPNGSNGGWISVAEVRGIPPQGASGSIGATGGTVATPEPASLLLLGSGLLGLALRRRK